MVHSPGGANLETHPNFKIPDPLSVYVARRKRFEDPGSDVGPSRNQTDRIAYDGIPLGPSEPIRPDWAPIAHAPRRFRGGAPCKAFTPLWTRRRRSAPVAARVYDPSWPGRIVVKLPLATPGLP